MNVHTSIIHDRQKDGNNTVSIMNEWIKKMCYIHAVDYCSVIKNNEALLHAIKNKPQKYYTK